MTPPHGSEPHSAHLSAIPAQFRPLTAAEDAAGLVLALGGGFSRGFAHLGVLEVLNQERLPVTAIVGTSIGGLLGAAYADGISVRDLCNVGRQVRLRDFLRFRKSEQGPERNDYLGQFVRKWFRTGTVEELPIPTMIVTTDLGSGAPYVITRGPIETALRAGIAFPGLCKPVEYEGRLLADGCLAAPVPTAIAARIFGGCVLGVAVSSATARAPLASAETNPGGMGSRSAQRRALAPSWSRGADILLEPALDHIAWNDFSRADEAFEAGAQAMLSALPRLHGALALRAQSAGAMGTITPPESGLAQ